MEPINKQDVLIRLLKDGHISNDEFKALYQVEPTETVFVPYTHTGTGYPVPHPPFLYEPWSQPFYSTCDGSVITCN